MLEDVRHASGIILSFLTELSDHVQMDEHTHEAVRDIFPLLRMPNFILHAQEFNRCYSR